MVTKGMLPSFISIRFHATSVGLSAPTPDNTVDPPTDDGMYVPEDNDPEDASEDELFDKSDDDDAPRPKKKPRGELRKQVEAARTPAAPSADGHKRNAFENPEV